MSGVLAQRRAEARAVEDVVAEHQRDALVADELLADDERLREPVGRGLHGVLEPDPECEPSPSRARNCSLYSGVVMIRISLMPGHHERRQRVVDHRLVVDRHQLLRDALGDRPEPGAGTAGEDDAAHRTSPLVSDRSRHGPPPRWAAGRMPPPRRGRAPPCPSARAAAPPRPRGNTSPISGSSGLMPCSRSALNVDVTR